MPNTSNDDVIIVGSLSDKELRDSIDKLVDYVGKQTHNMAANFVVSINTMKGAMKDFAVSQKVSVDLMQDAWKKMSVSFDAMLKAQQNATSSGNNSGAGGGANAAQEGTIGWLREQSRLQSQIVDQQKIGTAEKQKEVDKHAAINSQLKEELKSTKQIQQETAKRTLKNVLSLPQNELKEAEYMLKVLLNTASAYKTRKVGILSEEQWHKLNNAIAKTRQQIDKLQEKKPKSLKDVLGMDESSVDAIAKKMAALKRVTVDPQNTAQVKQLGDEYQRLKRLQAELMGQNIQMTHSNNYLAQSFGYIRNRLVYAMTLGAITSFTKQVYEIRGQYELLERSLGVLVNSFERGSQIFQELNQMAIESPFTLMELAGAAKQLTAYNFAANEVVDTTRRLADISAALGVPMERLTYNLGQIRAQTVLTARDARDFANAGLPIVASLAEHFTELEGKIVTTGDVYDRMSKKMVSYSDVMAVLNKMTDEGGKFFEFQAKQAETLRVQMANLNLAWNNMLNDIGKTNQGLLTLPVSGLKALFQNWQSIDRVLKSMLVTFGLWKALQVVAIRQQWAWAAATGATAKQMGVLGNAAKSFFGGLKALATNPWTWVFVGIQAIVDLAHQFWNARQEMHELNQEISDNANEASESMLSYLNNKGNKSTFELAKQNKLTAEQGERAWESLKGQIEQSAISANSLISELLTIDDINERVAKGFDYAERIQKAQAALQDLKDDSIEVNTDVGWFGMFGEGLVSDLKDYADYIEKYSEIARKNQMAGDVAAEWMHQVGIVKGARQEFLEELDDTAESINDFIRAYNITDPLQINEILERVRSQIKAKNPEIKGEAAKIFDISLDQKMSELTNGAVDRNASLWNMFMERLVHRSHNAFQDINDDWIKSNEKLSPEQQAAVDANLQYFKDSMPYAYDAVAKMVSDASQLRIKIGITFGGTNATDFQKQVNERIANAPKMLDFGGGAFLPTNNDNLSSWVKTQQQAIKSLGEENKKYNLDNSAWAKQKIKDNNTEIQQRKNLLDLFNQSYLSDADARKDQKQHKRDVDEVAQALQSELKVIREMQSNYDKLRKSGVSNMDAIDLASKGYEATIIRINQVLSKFGIDKFNAANFAGKDVRSLLQSLEEQRNALLKSGKVKTSSLQALDVEIQKLTVDAKTYDMKKVTDGLNSELGKIKDEYELAVELDADPELGDMFTEMFGIDTKALPHTFGDAYGKALEIARDKLRDAKLDIKDFDLMSANFAPDKEGRWNGVDVNSDLVKGLISLQKTWRDMFKKNITETEKILDDYIKKYGDYSDKIAEIEASRLEKLKKLNEAYYTEEMRKRPEYVAKLNAIEQGAKREKQQVDFDEFKNSRYYTMMFENLDYISTKTIRDMRDRVRELIDTMNNLTPEQLKTLISQYEKLEQKLVKRSPFKTLAKDLKEYFATTKERKAANQEFKNAQKEYDSQKKNVAALKEKYEQAKANSNTSQSYLDFLQIEIDAENDILKILKEQLDAAQKKADKYNLTAKLAKSEALAVAQVVGQNLQSLGELRDFLQQDWGVKLSGELNGLVDGLSKVGQGINKITSSATSGDVVGVITGVGQTIYGLYDGIASIFGGGSARTKRLNREIDKSKETVRRLSMAYDNLERAIDKSLGTGETEARRLAIANKEAQLAELERQKELEQSKRSKDRDDDAIKQYEETIHGLRNEIDDLKEDVVNNLWGEDVKSAAEAFVDAWVHAWRAGETTLDAIQEKMDDMIYNLIKKAMTSKIVETLLNPIYKELDRMTKKGSEGGVALTTNELRQLAQQAGVTAGEINTALGEFYGNLEQLGIVSKTENGSNEFSALQQGLQSMSESTANALEAYANSLSQQAYLRNDLLVQIRDTIMSFDMDVQLGVMSQMLLQLQQSYQVQQNIESILTGVLNPSGRAIVVELNS